MFDLAEAIGRSPFELGGDMPGATPNGGGRGRQPIIEPSMDHPALAPQEGLRLFWGGAGRIVSWSGSTEAAQTAVSSRNLLPDALIMESPHKSENRGQSNRVAPQPIAHHGFRSLQAPQRVAAWEDFHGANVHGETIVPFWESKSTRRNAVRSSRAVDPTGAMPPEGGTKETLVEKRAPRYRHHRPPPIFVDSPRGDLPESSAARDGCLACFCSCLGTEDGREEREEERAVYSFPDRRGEQDSDGECYSFDAIGCVCCLSFMAGAPAF